MDLANYDTSKKSAEGAEMPIKLKDGTLCEHDGKPFFLKLLGQDSEEFEQAGLSAMRAFEKLPEAEKTESKRERMTIAAITVGGLFFLDGKWLKVTPDNAESLYERFRWVQRDATRFALEDANFLPEQNAA